MRHGVSVWFDKECLKPGQPWEMGFADGLFASRIFVPVLSRRGLANFASLHAGSRCDNVLLEHEVALEQLEPRQMLADLNAGHVGRDRLNHRTRDREPAD